MNRLTDNKIKCMADFCEAQDCVNYESDGCCSYERYQRLAEYEDMEEQGLLVRLPCKLGDTVYVIHKGDYNHNWKPYVNEMCVVEINHKCDRNGKDIEWGLVLYSIINGTSTRYKISNNGKTIFLTREAAEKALEEVCRKNT